MQKVLNNLFLFIASLSLIILNLNSLPVNTQNQATNVRGLVVTPAISEQDADRGSVYNLNIKLENDTPDKTYNLEILTKTFKASDKEGVPELTDFTETDSFKDWLSFPSTSFNVNAGNKTDVPVQISVPKDANPGGYYYAIIFSNKNKPDPNSSTNQVVINERITALLFVNVKGKAERLASFESIQTSNNFVNDTQVFDPFFDPIEFTYKIGIKGSTFLRPRGNIFFYQKEGSPQFNVDINPDQKIILQNSTRTFSFALQPIWKVDWLSSSPDDLKKLDETKIETNHGIIFGKQTIEFKLSYINSDGDLDTLTTTRDIYFVPWKLGLIILFLLAILLTLYFLIRNLYTVQKNTQK